MRYALFIALLLNITCYHSNAEETISDTTEVSSRKVKIYDPLRKINLFTLSNFKIINKFLLRPMVTIYITTTTPDIRKAIITIINNFYNVLYIPNSALVFNSDLLLNNVGYTLASISIGLGFSSIQDELGLKRKEVSFVDLLRFYRFPELLYVSFGPIMMTAPNVIGNISLATLSGLIIPYSGSITSLLLIIDKQSTNLEKLDFLFQISPETLYENMKTQTYGTAKNFFLERDFLKQDGKQLKKQIMYAKYSEFLE